MNPTLLTLIFGFVALTASGLSKKGCSDAEAAKHVGEETTVTGKVFTVSTTGKGTTFMNFGERYPNHVFTGVIFARSSAEVGDVKQYEGKETALTGKIETGPDGKPQIIISSADQLKLAKGGPAPTPAPTVAPSPAPAPAPAMINGIPASELPSGEQKPRGKVALASNWSSPTSGGEMTRKDLAKLFGEVGSPGESLEIDPSLVVYPGIPVLTHIERAKKLLNLTSSPTSSGKIQTPGLPQGSLSATIFNGVFPGGFDRIYIITDTADQVVSVLLAEANTRARVPNESDTNGYHTYNFISGKAKGTNDLIIKHKLLTDNVPPGLVIVDSMLVDPDAPDPSAPRPTKGSSSKFGTSQKSKTGKVMERSRWFVPSPIVNLILRSCTGG